MAKKKTTRKKAAAPKKAKKKPTTTKRTTSKKRTPKKAKTAKRTKKSSATKKTSKKKASPKRRSATPPPKKPPVESSPADKSQYEKRKERVAARDRRHSMAGRDIGPIPACVDPERRAACSRDLQLALETYFPATFELGWSSQHIEVIDALDQVTHHGGLFALGMPRGSGKTSLMIRAGLLSILFGWRRYLVLIGAIGDAAAEMLDTIRVELESNEMLMQDFPEVCFPIRCLEGVTNRAKAQHSCGQPTAMTWAGKKLVLPTVEGSKISGAVIQTVSILGRIRGMQHLTQDGKTIRPDVFLGDDLQTDQSAKTVGQVERRENIMNGAVLNLAGPGKRIAGLVAITVQLKGDLADRMLNRDLNPQWHGRRFPLVDQWPTKKELWTEDYAALRDADIRAGNDLLPKATKFYRENRKMMDRGAIVPWSQRRQDHELSAHQHAWNLKLANPTTFDSEYQNNPAESLVAEGAIAAPDPDLLVQRVNGFQRGEIPIDATHVVSAIDIQQSVLYWLVMAMAEDFTGWVVDYGTWPKQSIGHYWVLGEEQATIQSVTGIESLSGSLYEAMNRLCDWLLVRPFKRDDGAILKIDQCLVDANWGPSTKTIYSWCRATQHANILPFHGEGITARMVPLAQRKKKRGVRRGDEWYMPPTRGTRMPRHVIGDTNAVKTIIAQRLQQPIGEPGAISFFQAPPVVHRMIADHCSAETPIETSGRGRELVEWMLKPGRDNHWLDTMVMSAVAALMRGCTPPGTTADGNTVSSGHRPKKSLAEMRAAAQKRKEKAA